MATGPDEAKGQRGGGARGPRPWAQHSGIRRIAEDGAEGPFTAVPLGVRMPASFRGALEQHEDAAIRYESRIKNS